MTTPRDLLAAGVAHHNAGRLADAEALYRRALTLDPLEANGWHLLGLIASAANRSDIAERLIRLALTLDPGLSDAYFNLGNACRRQERIAAAVVALDRARRLNPIPRNIAASGRTHAELAGSLAGGVRTLNDDFNLVHRHNREQPNWRTDSLTTRLGAQRRAEILAHIDVAQQLAPTDDVVRHYALLLHVSAGNLERGMAALGPADADGNPEFARLGAEVAWHLRQAEAARAYYTAFIRRKCAGEAPLRPLLADVAAAPAFAGRPAGPPPADRRPVLIYTHYGNPDFLHYSIGQSLISNPSARIILIGDRDNRIEGIEHYPMQAFAAATEQVVSLYLHDSGNAYCYELFCIARWFLFLDLCQREGIEEMFLLDSDYMLFTDLEQILPRCREVGVGFSLNSAHFSYFRRDTLAAFCNHVSSFFSGNNDTAAFHRANNSELFSDMAFIFDFQRRQSYLNFCNVANGGRFDYSITAPEGFRHTNGIKDIRFIDGAPHAFPEDGGPPVRFFGLHFQGFSKSLMKKAFHRQPWGGVS